MVPAILSSEIANITHFKTVRILCRTLYMSFSNISIGLSLDLSLGHNRKFFQILLRRIYQLLLHNSVALRIRVVMLLLLL
jgi:hypothetical protein